MAKRSKKTAGRPHTFTDELGARICQRIEQGKRPSVAAAEEGVSPTTFARWLSEARVGKTPQLQQFGDAVARARLVAEGHLVDAVRRGDAAGVGFGPARASLEILSRTNKHYSQKVQVAVESELERILDAVQRVCSAEDFQRVLAELAALDSAEEAGEDPGRAGDGPSVH